MRLRHVAAVSEVPRCGRRIPRVGVVRADLSIYADSVQRHEGNVNEHGNNGEPSPHDEGNEFCQQEEEGDDGNGHIEVGQPVS